MSHPLNLLLCCLTSVLFLGGPVHAANPANGKRIADVCAFCHGMFGQGTPSMLAPRLAGLPAWYLEKATRDFKKHVRMDPLMMRTTGLDRMSDPDIEDVVSYLSGIDLSPDMRFNVMVQEGEAALGEEIYNDDCKNCHGRDGYGKERKGAPPLAGQQPPYLGATIDSFMAKHRHHDNDPDDETFNDYTVAQVRNLLAYIASLDNARIRPGYRYEPPKVQPQVAQPSDTPTAFDTSVMQTVDVRQTMAKMPVGAAVTPADAIQAMKSRAYDLNLRVVGEQYISREHAARGIRSRYLTVLQFCSPSESYSLLEANPIFAGYMPCRIALVEDAEHRFWLIMFNMDIMLDSDLLAPEVVNAAVTINRNLLSIMAAGASGEF